MRNAFSILILIIACLILCTLSVYGQKNYDKTILTEFSDLVFKTDTTSIDSQISAAYNLRFKDPNTSYNNLKEALEASRQKNYVYGISQALKIMALLQKNKGDNKGFLSLSLESLKYCPPDKKAYMANLYCNIGNAYFSLESYDSALPYFYKALKIDEHPEVLVVLNINLGAIWGNLGEQDKALSFFKDAENIILTHPSHDNMEKLPYVYNGIASTYSNKQDVLTARKYCEKALKLPLIDEENKAVAYNSLGASYLQQQGYDPSKAIFNLTKAMLCHNVNPLYSVIEPRRNMGIAYALMGDYKKSEEYFTQALNMAKQFQSPLEVSAIYRTMSEVYNMMGNGNKAYYYLKAYDSIRDGSIEQNKTIHQLEVKYKLSEKDKELVKSQLILSQQQNKLRQKNTWIGCISSLILLLILSLGLLYRNIRHKQHIHQEKIRILEQEQEIAEFKSLMKGEERERARLAHEIHDGIIIQFSAVKMNLSTLPNNHLSLINSSDYLKIISSLDNATRELRKTAHYLMPDMLLEEGLFDAVFYFCRSVQESTGLPIDFQCYGTLPRMDVEFELTIYRIIQELIQNIVKHAAATLAIVQLSYTDKALHITIEDNGNGFNEKNLKGNNGMGLRSIRARVKALNGHMDIESFIHKGTTAYLEFETP